MAPLRVVECQDTSNPDTNANTCKPSSPAKHATECQVIIITVFLTLWYITFLLIIWFNCLVYSSLLRNCDFTFSCVNYYRPSEFKKTSCSVEMAVWQNNLNSVSTHKLFPELSIVSKRLRKLHVLMKTMICG